MDAHAISRRGFLTRTGLAGAGLLAETRFAAGDGPGKGIAIVHDPDDTVAAAPPAQWAVGQLCDALAARGVTVRVRRHLDEVTPEEICVLAGGGTAPGPREVFDRSGTALPDHPEALALVAGQVNRRPVLLACGRDAGGLRYALLELADRVAHADQPLTALEIRRPVVERPANPIRSAARLFTSDVEDRAWLHDRAFWPPYLDMLAAQRFNRFSLTLGLGYDFPRDIRDAYLHFAYPFLVAVPGYNVRAVPLPDAERDRNLDMVRFISDETAKRGLHFQLGLWTHAYQWADSPHANYTIEGLTPDRHAAYCRDALRTVLNACPAIAGVTFRIHGESGVAEGSYDFWKAVFDGVVKCGHKVEIDLHAKGLDQAMLDVALATGLPVNVSPKFWAEHLGLPYHQAAIRPLEMPPRDSKDNGFFSRSNGARKFLRYGYGDLLAEGRRYGVYYRIWPGTQRLLLWGDPAMAAGYGRTAGLCGSLGVEVCEPLSFKGRKGSGRPGGRTAYQDAALRPAADWEKYRYTYRLWGRLLYNPDADPDGWRRGLRRQFGAAAEAAEAALAHASRILPLVTTAHLPSAANNSYWPEVYTNQSIVDAAAPHPYGDTPSPKRFGTVSPLDPALFSRIDDWAADVLAGRPNAKYAPAEVAQWLQDLADTAGKRLAEAKGRVDRPDNPEWRRLAADVAVLSGLGHFFAWKLRAGLLWALGERGRDRPALEEAVKAYRTARAAWAELARQAEDVYVRDITFGLEKHLRGHWLDRLAALDQDVEKMAKLVEKPAPEGPAGAEGAGERLQAALRLVLAPPRRPSLLCRHTPPAPFRPGQPVAIELAPGPAEERDRPVAAWLHYRRVNQAEAYHVEEMRAQDERWVATVPGNYTQSPYALLYFFEFRDRPGRAWLYPGFEADLCNQPYFVVRQAASSRP
jgi:hypothetical protein